MFSIRSIFLTILNIIIVVINRDFIFVIALPSNTSSHGREKNLFCPPYIGVPFASHPRAAKYFSSQCKGYRLRTYFLEGYHKTNLIRVVLINHHHEALLYSYSCSGRHRQRVSGLNSSWARRVCRDMNDLCVSLTMTLILSNCALVFFFFFDY